MAKGSQALLSEELGTCGSRLSSSLSLCGHGGSQSPAGPPQAPGEHSLAGLQRQALCRPLGAALRPRREAAHARSVRLLAKLGAVGRLLISAIIFCNKF